MSVKKYKDYLNKITLGDSLEHLKKFPDKCIDAFVTDPPYILDTTPAGSTKVGGGGNISKLFRSESNNIDSISNGFNIEENLSEWERVSKKVNFFIFCSNSQISKLMLWGENRGYVTTLLVWNKTNPTPFCNGVWQSSLEFIVHIREKGATFQGNVRVKNKCYTSPCETSKWGHPTEKPLELVKRYIEICTNEGDIVCDPFSGSGTTAHGCVQLKRDFVALEIVKEHFDSSCERVKMAIGNVGLFAV